MPTHRHEQRPANDRQRDAWLDEMWQPCRELPEHQRAEKRRADRSQQRWLEEQEIAIPQPVEFRPQQVA